MISTAWRFIFLHVPKTGGNSMQLVLQPYSDDELFAGGQGDGTQRFGVRGRVTPNKHATLQAYSDALGGDLSEWRIAVTARDPLRRAVSHYFSPNRWAKTAGAARWNRKAFLAMLPGMLTLTDFVTVDGVVREPDRLIRQEHLEGDFAAFVRAVGLPLDASILPRVNQSAAASVLHDEAMADPGVREAVRSRFAADYELLDAWSRQSAGAPAQAIRFKASPMASTASGVVAQEHMNRTVPSVNR